MKLEKEEEQEIAKYVSSLGGLCLKLVIFGKRGWGDRTCFLPGPRIIIFEFKRQGRPNGESAQQKFWRSALQRLGFEWYVVHSADEAKEYLNP